MTGMKKIFLNSSYKRAGYIYKSPRNKLFGTSNCKSLSALSSQSSQSPPGYTGHVLGCEAPHQLGHISPPGRGRARCGRREPGGAGAGAAHVRAVGAQLWWVQHWSPWGHCEDTALGMRWYHRQDGGHHTLLGAQSSSVNTQQNMWYVPQVTRWMLSYVIR